MNRTVQKKNKYYLTNDQLLPVLLHAKKLGRVTPELGKMILLIVDRYAEHPWWCGYTDNWKAEMKSDAIVALVRGLLKFDPSYAEKRGKKPNAFSYATTVVYRSFKNTRDRDKKHQLLEDKLPAGLF